MPVIHISNLIAAVAVIFLAACADDNEPTATIDNPGNETVHAGATDTLSSGTKPLVLNGCYEMVLKQDTAFLMLQVKDTTVSGNLSYRWYSKDSNEGTIKGVLRNDTIYADYTFQSEGVTSIREVIFKIKDTTLLQGTGELTEQNGKVIYRNKQSLSFNETYPFIKVACYQSGR